VATRVEHFWLGSQQLDRKTHTEVTQGRAGENCESLPSQTNKQRQKKEGGQKIRESPIDAPNLRSSCEKLKNSPCVFQGRASPPLPRPLPPPITGPRTCPKVQHQTSSDLVLRSPGRIRVSPKGRRGPYENNRAPPRTPLPPSPDQRCFFFFFFWTSTCRSMPQNRPTTLYTPSLAAAPTAAPAPLFHPALTGSGGRRWCGSQGRR